MLVVGTRVVGAKVDNSRNLMLVLSFRHHSYLSSRLKLIPMETTGKMRSNACQVYICMTRGCEYVVFQSWANYDINLKAV